MNVQNLAVRRPVSSRGQVVIPKDIRTLLGLRAGETVVFEVRAEEVVLKADSEKLGFLDDFLNTPKLKKRMSPRQLKRLLLEKYDHSVR